MTEPADDAYPMALHVDEMFVDQSYQRVCDVVRARKMSADWDRRLAGIIEVSDRGEGVRPRYALVDGQHRWAAAGFLKSPPVLVANVHEGLTVADEAALFDKLNRQRKQPSPWDHWRARRAAGDLTVLGIERTAAAKGLEVSDRVRDGSLWCISTLEKITASAGGLELLAAVLTVLTSAYGTQRSAFEAPVVHGTSMVLHTFDERCDVNRLIAALTEIPPQRIRQQASIMRDAGTSGSLAKLAAVAIANQYNRQSGGGRLNWPPDWKGVLAKAPRTARTAAAAAKPTASVASDIPAKPFPPKVTPPATATVKEVTSDYSAPRTVPDAMPAAGRDDIGQWVDAIAEREGQTVAAIAAQLGIPERTVRRVHADLGITAPT